MESAPRDGIVVAACNLIVSDGAVLLVRESKDSARGRYNLPAGKVEPGERIVDAAEREAREETGLQVAVVALVGIYQCPRTSENTSVVNFVFESQVVAGSLTGSAEHPEARYVAYPELRRMADAGMLRGTHIVRAVDALRNGRRLPTDFIDVVPLSRPSTADVS